MTEQKLTGERLRRVKNWTDEYGGDFTEREKTISEGRERGLSRAALGKRYKVTVERIRHIENKAMEKLKVAYIAALEAENARLKEQVEADGKKVIKVIDGKPYLPLFSFDEKSQPADEKGGV